MKFETIDAAIFWGDVVFGYLLGSARKAIMPQTTNRYRSRCR